MHHSTEKKTLKILFWNIRSYAQRQHEISHILQDIDICICVETWLQEHNKFRIPGFIRNNLAFRETKHATTTIDCVEMCGIEINNFDTPLEIIACYRPPGINHTQEQWHSIIQKVNTNKSSLLVGDFNAHHTYWNCHTTDVNGTRLSNAIDEHNLFLHNVDSHTYIDIHRDYKSNLDLVLSSTLASDITNVNVLDETWGSDHFPIQITVDVNKHVYTKKTYKIKSTRTDWNKVNEILDFNYVNFLSSNYDHLSSNSKYDFFMETISNIVKLCTPRKNIHTFSHKQKNPVRWWDIDCDVAKRNRLESFKKWEKTKDLTDLIHYKKCTAIAKKLFKAKKKESVIKFAESLDFHTNSKYVWDTFKVLKKCWLNTSPHHTTSHLQNNNYMEIALDKVSPPWAPTDPETLPTSQQNPFFETPFTFIEFNTALDSKTTHTSPGIDGVDYEILQRLPVKYKLLLLDIFNDMYRENNYPESWKQSFLHFIPKSDGKNFRPIALTSCTCKLFETIVKSRLQWWVETQNIIPANQSGFRKGKSCSDNLTSLTLKIDEAFSEKKASLQLFKTSMAPLTTSM